VRARADWTLMAPVPFSLVVFRYERPGMSEAEIESANERIMGMVNATGEAFISHTKLGGRYTLRLAVGNLRTTQAHVERAWRLLQEAADRV
jgi:aromatic-L-amino-acid/L-tryptophan decarboxylase